MDHLIKYTIGVDISKDKFDVCMLSIDVKLRSKIKGTRKFGNTLSGFKEFLLWLTKHSKTDTAVEILMEATGVYHERLAIWLTEQGQQIFVVLPNKSSKYMQALGLKTKNDGVDARGLAMMCIGHRFEQWKPIGRYNYELRLLTRHYQSTQEIKTVFQNQLHALSHSGYTSKEVGKQLKKSIDLFDKQVKSLKKEIVRHIDSNKEVKRKVEHICLIKGVDVLSVATIIAETNGFELFTNQSQLVSYAGYDVVENQSGNRVGRTKISKKGNGRIRRILHMPALNVVRFDETPFKRLYQRVYDRSKIKMKGYVAVQKKLLIVMYTLWKNDLPYSGEHEEKMISGNDEQKDLFPFFSERESKKIVPQLSSTTQDELQYNESLKVLFPLLQN
ncbi:IS110 family transposase [Pedobacter sp. SD-b]|uniref:IS110 family transposase n=1 Tax=Pedobacter segetis TaxID=2793069 RepID=A0ABS1BK59_9SPHI|nr:IS110 family transposase [Pedobacter segetis]MBK0383280.1 IS110 family transposase [Pedobacter segetis]